MIFDGRQFAAGREKRIRLDVEQFISKNNRRPKLASIFNPDHKPSQTYTNIKKKKAEDLNILFETYPIDEFRTQLYELVPMLNQDKSVDGVMVQVPLFSDDEGRQKENQLIGEIDINKDVDGLTEHSRYMPAVVRAVLQILMSRAEVKQLLADEQTQIVVLGSKGVVGSGVMEQLHKLGALRFVGMDSDNLDPEKIQEADVVISAAGVQGLFSADYVKKGVVLIDVGYPKGDFAEDVANKASFYTPVPGGVGPVTVISLFENLLNL